MIVNDTLKGFATDVNGECRNEEWFRWRFEQNPCGKAILSCAFDKESIVACVAVEKIPGVIDGQKNIFGFVHYTFIREGYDANEVIPRLIEQAEIEAQNQRLSSIVMIGSHYSGLSVLGWKESDVRVRYRVKFVKPLRSIFKLSDTAKLLIANLRKPIDEQRMSINLDFMKKSEDQVETDMQGNIEYLRWRFLMAEDFEFLVINDQDVFAIAVVGCRGSRIKDAQIIMMVSKKTSASPERYRKKVLETIKEQVHPDTISCMDSSHYLTTGNTIGVPHLVPVCYKWFGEQQEVDLDEMVNTMIRYYV